MVPYYILGDPGRVETRFKDGKDKALALYAFIAEVDEDVGDLVASETRQDTKRKSR